MPRSIVRNTSDCSKKTKNPTRLLQENYEGLLKIEDLALLKNRTTKIVERSVITRKNLVRFRMTRDNIETLAEFQKYITNYILAGSGMSTNFR